MNNKENDIKTIKDEFNNILNVISEKSSAKKYFLLSMTKSGLTRQKTALCLTPILACFKEDNMRHRTSLYLVSLQIHVPIGGEGC